MDRACSVTPWWIDRLVVEEQTWRGRFAERSQDQVFDALLSSLEKEIRSIHRDRFLASGMPPRWARARYTRWRSFRDRVEDVSRHPFSPPSLLMRYPRVPWRWDLVRPPTAAVVEATTTTTFFTVDFFKKIEQKLGKGVNFNAMRYRVWSRSCYLPLPLVLAFPYRPWDYAHLQRTRRWTLRWILQLQHIKRLSFRNLSSNVLLTETILFNFPTAPWDWRALASNPAIRPRRLLFMRSSALHTRWRWANAWTNPRLCDEVLGYLRENRIASPDTHHRGLLSNYFFHDPRYQLLSAVKIQRAWRAHRWYTRLCRLGALGSVLTRTLPSSLLYEIHSFL